jgi:hypothetical protein
MLNIADKMKLFPARKLKNQIKHEKHYYKETKWCECPAQCADPQYCCNYTCKLQFSDLHMLITAFFIIIYLLTNVEISEYQSHSVCLFQGTKHM